MPACPTSSAATTKARNSWPGCSAEFADAGLVNIVGGCCGTTPEHIRAIVRAVEGKAPRKIPEMPPLLRLSGLEAFTLTPEIPFVNVGERTNVTGSAKFRKLVTAGDYAAALAIARDQVENGAQIIDVNMDEGLLDSEKAMTTFLNLIAAEPDIARVPVMVDSSKFSVIEAGLKCLQGKPVVNSISMKEGEAAFIEHAKTVRRYGAAVVVMAFDEQGQADTFERKMRDRQARLRHPGRPGWLPAAGHHLRPEHLRDRDRDGGAQRLRRRLHRGGALDPAPTCRSVHVSGGVSNLSFSFRGNEPVREAMHSVFLYHAIKAGMDMGIVNAGQMAVYDDLNAGIARGVRGRGAQPPRRRRRAAACARRALPRPRQGEEGSRPRAGANGRWASGSPTRWCTASPTSSKPTSRRRGSRPSARCT